MGLLFTVPEPIAPKPPLRLPPSVALLATLAGAELGHGHARAAERIADVAEQMRARLAVEAAQ